MIVFDWPATLYAQDVEILPPSQTAGMNTSISGKGQVVPVVRPPFVIKMEFGNLFGREVLAWRAIVGSLEGQANAVRVPLFDLWHAANDAAIGAGLASHSDGSSFSDGALYLTSDLDGVTVTAERGDRVITADFGAYGQLLEAGQYFGLGDYPFLASSVTWEGSVATIRSTRTMPVSFADQALRLRPVMIGSVPEDEMGGLRLKHGRYGAPMLELVERFG